MNQDLFIISHIPKTAGTTLRRHLKNYLSVEDELIHLANSGKVYCKNNGLLFFSDRSQAEKMKTRVIIGHDVNFDTKFMLTGKRIREVVTFREPFKWEISRYNQHVNRMVKRGKSPVSFKVWITEINKFHSQFDWFLANYMCLKGFVNRLTKTMKLFLLTQALNQFELVCTLENFSELVSYLLAELNLPQDLTLMENHNVVGVHKSNYFKETGENMELLSKHCDFDLTCYAMVKQLEAEKNYK